jgi:hypothetical protein
LIEEPPMPLAYTTVNLDHFVRDLKAGDPVVWLIVVGTVLATGFALYRKYRTFSTKPPSDAD